MLYLIQHCLELRIITVQCVNIEKLYFSKLKLEGLRRKWDYIMYVLIHIVHIDGLSRLFVFLSLLFSFQYSYNNSPCFINIL